jgi:hypothetical protein
MQLLTYIAQISSTRTIRQYRESCLEHQVGCPLTFQWAKTMAQIDLTTFFTRSLTTVTLFPVARSKERHRISTLSSLSLSPTDILS